MADWLSGREIDGMLTMEIMAVMTQMASRVAATPMAAPMPESRGPSMVTLRPERILAPTRSPTPPSRMARPKTTTTAVVVFAMSLLTWRDTWGARTAPRARPPQNPPKEKSWTAAPRKKPCAAEAATATRMMRSTPFMRA